MIVENHIYQENLVAKNFLQEISVFFPGKIHPGSGNKWPHLAIDGSDVAVVVSFEELDTIFVSMENVLIQKSANKNFPIRNPNLIENIVAYIQARMDEL